MARFQEMIYCMKPDDKKARFGPPLSGALEIGVGEESDEKGQACPHTAGFQGGGLRSLDGSGRG